MMMESPIKFHSGNQYATVKLFAAWWAAELARKLPEGMTVNAVSPGSTPGTNADRSATVRAKTNCSVVKVPKEQFTELIKNNPATIHSLLIDMANSIVNLNEQLVGLRGSHGVD